MSQQINLVSPLLLKQRFAFGLREMVLGLMLILLGALAWAGVAHYRANALEALAAQAKARQEKAQLELDRLSAIASRPTSALLAERVEATQAQVAQRKVLLTTINNTIDQTSVGFSPRMRALARGSTEGVWLNGFTLSPDYVALKGSALNAGLLTTYMDRLGKQPPFAGMKFSGMKAALAQPEGSSENATAERVGHIDFSLYSGSEANTTAKGEPHGQ